MINPKTVKYVFLAIFLISIFIIATKSSDKHAFYSDSTWKCTEYFDGETYYFNCKTSLYSESLVLRCFDTEHNIIRCSSKNTSSIYPTTEISRQYITWYGRNTWMEPDPSLNWSAVFGDDFIPISRFKKLEYKYDNRKAWWEQ